MGPSTSLRVNPVIISMGYTLPMFKKASEHKLLTGYFVLIWALPLISSRTLWNSWVTDLTLIIISAFLLFTLSSRYKWNLLAMMLMLIILLHAQWGITQFVVQDNLNLYLLGESRISPDSDGVAKFNFNDEKLIRSYGPFVHSNNYSGVLLLGLLLFALAFRRLRFGAEVYLYPVYVLILGLILSFSRSSYIGAILLFALMIFSVQKLLKPMVVLVILITVVVLSPLLTSRFVDPEDVAVNERLMGVYWAWSLIGERSYLVADGLSYKERLQQHLSDSAIPYKHWQIDYVHSVPLLVLVQIGIVPTILIGSLLLWTTIKLYGRKSIWIMPILPLIFFDHYLLTDSASLVYLVLAYTLMPRLLA
jgi:hypothetical protein